MKKIILVSFALISTTTIGFASSGAAADDETLKILESAVNHITYRAAYQKAEAVERRTAEIRLTAAVDTRLMKVSVDRMIQIAKSYKAHQRKNLSEKDFCYYLKDMAILLYRLYGGYQYGYTMYKTGRITYLLRSVDPIESIYSASFNIPEELAAYAKWLAKDNSDLSRAVAPGWMDDYGILTYGYCDGGIPMGGGVLREMHISATTTAEDHVHGDYVPSVQGQLDPLIVRLENLSSFLGSAEARLRAPISRHSSSF